MSTKANEAAFPRPRPCVSGMTFREYAAVAAMQGILSDSATLVAVHQAAKQNNISDDNACAKMAIEHADALIAELEK